MENLNVNDLSPKEIAEKVVEVGCTKAKLPFFKMLVLAILAGVYIGFGGELATMISHDLKIGIGFTQFLAGSVFSVGLMLVVIGGAELFTGNSLMISACLQGKAKVSGLLKNWGTVYLGNFIGGVLLALLMFMAGLWKFNDASLGLKAVTIANAKVNLSFLEAFSRGILCNWLVCLAVWLAFGSRNIVGKIFAIYFPIMAFVASGFEHSIANMYFIPYGLFIKSSILSKFATSSSVQLPNLANLTWGNFFIKNLLPVTFGNIVGGAFFVGTIYWYVYLKEGSLKK
ncbi:MAG: formate/nitrite transporter family protein [Caldiserica bacterium]|nr:formate/nitrite transporter family protein [Caldisericota bacterium]